MAIQFGHILLLLGCIEFCNCGPASSKSMPHDECVLPPNADNLDFTWVSKLKICQKS